MYRETKIIDNVLHYRTTPKGKWHEYNQIELTTLFMDAMDEIEYWKHKYNDFASMF